jgi:hypothetical protein
VLDEVVQVRRDTKAAKRLLKRLLKKQGCPPRRMSADKLVSYTAARRQILPRTEHRSRMSLNNRAENSHLPLRRRERAMQGFRSPRGLQSFTSVFSAVRNLFVPLRCRRSALATHLHRLQNHGDKGLRRLLTSIRTRIDVHPNHVIVALDRNRPIDALGRDDRDAAPSGAGEAAASNTNPTQPEDRMILSIPATLQRAGHELRFVIAGDQRTPDPDPALLRILARAHVIRDRFFTVEGLTIEEVAVQEKLTPSYITRLLRLTFLAPDILTGILNGAQPPALTAVRLIADTCLPLEWHEQRIKLGLDV